MSPQGVYFGKVREVGYQINLHVLGCFVVEEGKVLLYKTDKTFLSEGKV